MEVLIDKISFKNTIIDKIHIKGDKKDIIDFFKEILLEKQNHYDYSPYIYNIPQKTPPMNILNGKIHLYIIIRL